MKERITEDDVWETLFKSLNFNDTTTMPISNKKALTAILRASGAILPNDIRRKMWSMIDIYKNTKEFKDRWLYLLFKWSGFTDKEIKDIWLKDINRHKYPVKSSQYPLTKKKKKRKLRAKNTKRVQ